MREVPRRYSHGPKDADQEVSFSYFHLSFSYFHWSIQTMRGRISYIFRLHRFWDSKNIFGTKGGLKVKLGYAKLTF